MSHFTFLVMPIFTTYYLDLINICGRLQDQRAGTARPVTSYELQVTSYTPVIKWLKASRQQAARRPVTKPCIGPT
jgi:hypothetical protein